MFNPPFRSPREKVGGLYHFGRMLDKIRLNLRGELPEEYKPNLGLSIGLDGHCCGFLGVEFSALVERTRQGGTDDEILEWCFAQGFRPNPVQKRIWNGFASKFGWRDRAAAFVTAVKKQDGLENRDDLVTAFDQIDFREGRLKKDEDV
jgi:hypothetical protein